MATTTVSGVASVAEQLGMLMSAGWSLSAALNRVAERGSGNCSKDLTRVIQRMRQGLTEAEALQEWTDLAGVDALGAPCIDSGFES